MISLSSFLRLRRIRGLESRLGKQGNELRFVLSVRMMKMLQMVLPNRGGNYSMQKFKKKEVLKETKPFIQESTASEVTVVSTAEEVFSTSRWQNEIGSSKNYKDLSEMREDSLIARCRGVVLISQEKNGLDHESYTALELLKVLRSQVSKYKDVVKCVGSTSGIRACALRNFDLEVMELENTQNNALAKLPMLKLGEYEMWEIRIKQYFQIQDYALWEVIENRNSWVPIPVTTS
ncbi:hypothetical protein Tco_0837035 [Tanacetum coccineum]